jgi:uncharacterized protein (DUF983 family)
MTEPATITWTARSDAKPSGPGMGRALLRGITGRCPNCGQAKLFTGWLRQVEVCPHCAAPLGSIRADDAPPYFVIFIVGHLVIGTQVLLDGITQLSLWTEAAIFLPITLVLSLALLRPAKGATVGLMWQLGMVPRDDE